MCRSEFCRRPSLSEVAERLKGFNEGKVPVRQFFSENICYSDPLIKVANAEVVALLFTVMWFVLESVTYEVKSTYEGPRGSVMVEAEVTYTWVKPLRWLLKTKKQHFYHTLNITYTPESWKCSYLEAIRDSYTMSLPSRILTTPFLMVLNGVFQIKYCVFSIVSTAAKVVSRKKVSKC
eukprot:TRINITY_DN124_c9_g1_i1.p1 TRINITY_DN124_c9_g1~~TRINITY_DN124_c9_g1_i1.p1  ORF type:complete len:178 (+),score=45.51 TRINITY_DN124_c9_g1_i1:89-622(+)